MLRIARKLYAFSLLLSLALFFFYVLFWRRRGEHSQLTGEPEKGNLRFILDHRYSTASQQSISTSQPYSRGTGARRQCVPKDDRTSGGGAGRRYVIGLNYWEQINMALGNMFALSRLANDWTASLVQPFTLNSRLYGIPHLRADHKWNKTNATMLPLDSLFDTDDLNSLACFYGLSKLAKFHEFVKLGERNLTLLHLVHNRESRERPVLLGPQGRDLHRRLAIESVIDCRDFPFARSLGRDIVSFLNQDGDPNGTHPFRLTQHFCVNASMVTTPKELARRCKLGTANEDLSLLVLNWRGLSETKLIRDSAKGLHKNQRLPVNNLTLFRHPRGGTEIFRHSREVLATAERFMAFLGLADGQFIGVHVRSEKIGLRNTRIDGFLTGCMNKVMRLCQSIRQFRHYPVVFLSDYGTHGSDSCFACKGAKKIRHFFASYNITPIRFDPKEFNSYDDSGFVSAVEMELLVRSRSVVLAGGGAFEKQIAMQKRLLKGNGSSTRGSNHLNNVYKVCWDDNIGIYRHNNMMLTTG